MLEPLFEHWLIDLRLATRQDAVEYGPGDALDHTFEGRSCEVHYRSSFRFREQ